MPTPSNSINEATTGICGFTGTAFVGSPVTNHGVVLGSSTSSTLGNVGPSATAGQVLQSAGASADPAFSTATYPSTAGTSGNVLTSDGTNWTSATAPGGGLVTITGTLTSLQIKSLHATPVQVLAAPGVGKIIKVQQVAAKMNYGGSNVFVASAGQTLNLYYATTTSAAATLGGATLTSASTQISLAQSITLLSGAVTLFDNMVLNWWNSSATEISGNASNDNTVTWSITYQIVAI